MEKELKVEGKQHCTNLITAGSGPPLGLRCKNWITRSESKAGYGRVLRKTGSAELAKAWSPSCHKCVTVRLRKWAGLPE